MGTSGGVMKRQKRASKRGRLLPLAAACSFGYLIGAVHVATLRDIEHSSAADAVSVRFPKEWAAASAITLAAVRSSRAEAELFRPVPMIASSQTHPSADPALAETVTEGPATAASQQPMVRTAALESGAAPGANSDLAKRPRTAAAAKPSVIPAHAAPASRPSYILDDAQIASIKVRLHLTPDQERMWPAVEAALRNMAYKRTQQAAAHGGARNVQAAAVDPEAVEGLKSAAVPLIMSFNSEQKEEVRSLAHVMGLDQLASQF
jgi:zinc resistance-associated protein